MFAQGCQTTWASTGSSTPGSWVKLSASCGPSLLKCKYNTIPVTTRWYSAILSSGSNSLFVSWNYFVPLEVFFRIPIHRIVPQHDIISNYKPLLVSHQIASWSKTFPIFTVPRRTAELSRRANGHVAFALPSEVITALSVEFISEPQHAKMLYFPVNSFEFFFLLYPLASGRPVNITMESKNTTRPNLLPIEPSPLTFRHLHRASSRSNGTIDDQFSELHLQPIISLQHTTLAFVGLSVDGSIAFWSAGPLQ